MNDRRKLKIVPLGGFGYRFESGWSCDVAQPGIGIEHQDMDGHWHSSVMTKEDAIALRDFLDSEIPNCITSESE